MAVRKHFLVIAPLFLILLRYPQRDVRLLHLQAEHRTVTVVRPSVLKHCC